MALKVGSLAQVLRIGAHGAALQPSVRLPSHLASRGQVCCQDPAARRQESAACASRTEIPVLSAGPAPGFQRLFSGPCPLTPSLSKPARTFLLLNSFCNLSDFCALSQRKLPVFKRLGIRVGPPDNVPI